jgi:hypothetical protein
MTAAASATVPTSTSLGEGSSVVEQQLMQRCWVRAAAVSRQPAAELMTQLVQHWYILLLHMQAS